MMGPDLAYLMRSLTNVRPSDNVIAQIELLREEAKQYGIAIFEHVPESAERTLAVRHLEESVMWAVKAQCLNDPDARQIPIGEK